jgi:hypothetical protein
MVAFGCAETGKAVSKKAIRLKTRMMYPLDEVVI